MAIAYPDEAISFASLPYSSPLNYLDYGLITEKIQDTVIKRRREIRDERLEFLVNNTRMIRLKKCLQEWDTKIPPQKRIFGRRGQGKQTMTSVFSSKSNLLCILRDPSNPLFHTPLGILEDAHTVQKQGPTVYKEGDHVEIITDKLPSPSESEGIKLLYSNHGVVVKVHKQWSVPRDGSSDGVEVLLVPGIRGDRQSPVFTETCHKEETIILSPWSMKKIGEDNRKTRLRRAEFIRKEKENAYVKKRIFEEHVVPILMKKLKYAFFQQFDEPEETLMKAYSLMISSDIKMISRMLYHADEWNSQRRRIIYIRANGKTMIWVPSSQSFEYEHGPQLSKVEIIKRTLPWAISKDRMCYYERYWFQRKIYSDIDVLDDEWWKRPWENAEKQCPCKAPSSHKLQGPHPEYISMNERLARTSWLRKIRDGHWSPTFAWSNWASMDIYRFTRKGKKSRETEWKRNERCIGELSDVMRDYNILQKKEQILKEYRENH